MVVRLYGVVGEIPPFISYISNVFRNPENGQCQVGSLTGAVAS